MLYHDLFGKFIADFGNKDLPISKKILEVVGPFVQDMANGYRFEDERCEILEKHLKKVIGPMEMVENEDKTKSDWVITVLAGLSIEFALIILVEVKNEIGTGGCDPYTQGGLSYVRRWAQNAFKDLRQCCNCPSIIIAVAGPWICVLGAVYLEKGIVDPFADFIPLM